MGYGLSPRLRGNPRCTRPPGGLSRSIPAPAGKPESGGSLKTRRTVYPRACGETLNQTAHLVSEYGPIPAPAGKPRPAPGPGSPWPVYPRACGETDDSVIVCPNSMGLSPRLRGNPPRIPPAPAAPRSIPAPAGKPASDSARTSRTTVYPRACGETSIPRENPHWLHGLSPRLRGNHPGCWRSVGRAEVYPRACGETQMLVHERMRLGGLSPRLRGNPIANSGLLQPRRSIPAPAGKPD